MLHILVGMPSGPFLYANDLIDVLKKKHASGTYKSMVDYPSTGNFFLMYIHHYSGVQLS